MKETKTVQVYPSDSVVNATIREYGSFGWEVINNQRCQEFDGQTRGIDGSVVNNYSTFNKITFTREKNSAWYEEVSQMEKEYYALKDTSKTYAAQQSVLRKPSPQGAMGVLLGVLLYFMYIFPGIIYTVVRCSAKSKYKKQYEKELADFETVYHAKIRELNDRQEEIIAQAEKCIREKS
ncbi:MAG: hypothetical protein K2O89_02000 [Clostridia bacterium]|nr:hypothetical protein [Clostridia bacterium]